MLWLAAACGPAVGGVEDTVADGSGGGDDSDGEGDPIAACDGPLPRPVVEATFEEDGEIDSTHVIEHVVADAEFVYFADGVGLKRVPRCGGSRSCWSPTRGRSTTG